MSYIKNVSNIIRKSFNLDGDAKAIFEAFGNYWGDNKTVDTTSLVEACVNTWGNFSASSRHRLYKSINGDEKEVFEHPFIDMMGNPNNFQTWWEIKYFWALYQAFFGNVYLLKLRDGLGTWRQVQFLPPKSVKPVSSATEFISHYIYQHSDKEYKFQPKDIIHIRYPWSGSLIEGSPLISKIYNQLSIDKFQTSLMEQFYRNGGFAGSIWSTTAKLENDSYERAVRQLKEKVGVNNNFQVMLGDNGLQPIKAAYSIKDMDITEQRKLTTEEILSAFRIPKIMVGGSSDTYNRASAEAAINVYATTFIDPDLNHIDEVFNKHIKMEFGSKWILKHDKVSPKDIQLMLEYYEKMTKMGAMTINEVRKEENYDRFDFELAGHSMVNVGGAIVDLNTEKQIGQVPNNVPPKQKE